MAEQGTRMKTVSVAEARRRSLVAAIVSALLSIAVMAAVSVWYTNRVDRESDRENRAVVERLRQADQSWCTLLRNLDRLNKTNPPQTEGGRTLAADVHKQLDELDCPPQ